MTFTQLSTHFYLDSRVIHLVFHSPITRRRREGALPAVTAAVVVAAPTVVIAVGVPAVHRFLGDHG